MHNEAQSLYDILKKLLLATVPKIYLAILNHRIHGMANVTPKAILAHLMARHAGPRQEQQKAQCTVGSHHTH